MQNAGPINSPRRLRPDVVLIVAVLTACAALSFGAIVVGAGHLWSSDVKQLAEDLRSSDDPVVRRRAAWALGEHEGRDGVIACVDGLRDRQADVRLVSAWALGEIKDKGTVAPLIEVLRDDDDVLVREMAALALGEIEDPSAVDALMDAFERDQELRLAVVWALGEIERAGSRKAKKARQDAIAAMGRRPWKNQQVWTGRLDKRHSHSEDVGAILRRLRSDDAGTRREAALDLGYLGIRHRYESPADIDRVVDALIETLRDPVPEVRAAAVWSLDEINPSRSSDYRREQSIRSGIDKIRRIVGLS